MVSKSIHASGTTTSLEYHRRKELQHRPTVTEMELSAILSNAKGRYAVLFSLLAGTGLRIGEALALKITDLSPDCFAVNVRRSIWHGQEHEPKTPNAVRIVDIAEPLPQLLQGYVNGKVEYLYCYKEWIPTSATKCTSRLTRNRQEDWISCFPSLPDGDIASRPCAGGSD